MYITCLAAKYLVPNDQACSGLYRLYALLHYCDCASLKLGDSQRRFLPLATPPTSQSTRIPPKCPSSAVVAARVTLGLTTPEDYQARDDPRLREINMLMPQPNPLIVFRVSGIGMHNIYLFKQSLTANVFQTLPFMNDDPYQHLAAYLSYHRTSDFMRTGAWWAGPGQLA